MSSKITLQTKNDIFIYYRRISFCDLWVTKVSGIWQQSLIY